MEVDLSGKRALVTGASTGIGAATAVKMGNCGAHVGVNYFASKDQARAVVKRIADAGGWAKAYRADVTKPEQVERLFAEFVKDTGGLDILVANVGGLVVRSPIADLSVEDWHRTMDLNATSCFLCCREALRIFRKTKSGVIVTVSSVAARMGGGGNSVHYAASKGAVSTLSIGLAKEVAPDGVRVVCVAPGVVETPFHEKFTEPERMPKLLARIPLGRAGRPEEIADVITFAASDDSGFTAGSVLEIAGGGL